MLGFLGLAKFGKVSSDLADTQAGMPELLIFFYVKLLNEIRKVTSKNCTAHILVGRWSFPQTCRSNLQVATRLPIDKLMFFVVSWRTLLPDKGENYG